MQKEVFPNFVQACLESLQEERFFGTANHYFYSNFRLDEMCPTSLEDKIIASILALWNDPTKTSRHSSNSSYRILNMDEVRACLTQAKLEISKTQSHVDLLESQKKRVFSAVKAHFEVEKKTFTDIVLKKTKAFLIEKHKNWVQQHIFQIPNIAEFAKENEGTVQLRKDLLSKMERLDKCMSFLRDIPLPANAMSCVKSESSA